MPYIKIIELDYDWLLGKIIKIKMQNKTQHNTKKYKTKQNTMQTESTMMLSIKIFSGILQNQICKAVISTNNPGRTGHSDLFATFATE